MYIARVTRTGNSPYQVLGVERTATQDEIKTAYRKLAMRYHPDRNPGDSEAEERFKQVSEAYATLRDPEARARFDQYGNAGGRPDFQSVDWNTIFREADIHIDWDMRGGVPKTGNAFFDVLFGAVTGMMRSSGLLPGEHREVSTRVPVSLARKGGSLRVKVPGPSVCAACRGSGRQNGRTCQECGGRRIVRTGSMVDVQLPPAVKSGTKLRLKGLGGPGTPPGDVFITLDVTLPEGVRMRGSDLFTDLYLTPLEAARGVTTNVVGVPVEVPSGSGDGETVRVPSGGLGGDLFVTVHQDLWRGLLRMVRDWWRSIAGGELQLATKE